MTFDDYKEECTIPLTSVPPVILGIFYLSRTSAFGITFLVLAVLFFVLAIAVGHKARRPSGSQGADQ
jgi:hypothetical protein